MSESQYVGALLLQPDIWWTHPVQPDDLTDLTARTIAEKVGELHQAGKPVDVVTVAEATGLEFRLVANYAQDVVSITAAKSAADEIVRKARRRRAALRLVAARTRLEDGEDEVAVISSLADEMEGATGESVTISQALEAWEERKKRKRPRTMETQIPTLNGYLYLEGGELVTIAGRPGTFKSAFALHVSRYAALRNTGVGLISLEMPAWSLASRWEKQTEGASPAMIAEVNQAPVYINDSTHDLYGIESQIVQWAKRDKAKAVIVDYLQLIESPKADTRDLQIGQITRRMKLLAMRLDITIVILAQLNREVEKHNRRPILSDLRESGNIEQDSNAVLFLHKYEDKGEEIFELGLAKNRNGPTGWIPLKIDKQRYRIEEMAR